MALSPLVRILSGSDIVWKSSFCRVLALLLQSDSNQVVMLRTERCGCFSSGVPAKNSCQMHESALIPVFGAVTPRRLDQVTIQHFVQRYTRRNPSYLVGLAIPALLGAGIAQPSLWDSEDPETLLLPEANL